MTKRHKQYAPPSYLILIPNHYSMISKRLLPLLPLGKMNFTCWSAGIVI
ncbi:hypothetical protein ACQGSH_24745 [Bacillus wiedmannii]|nr:hypothetical protein [Bacillus wiedmannii]